MASATEDQVLDLVDEAEKVLNRIRRDAAEVLRRAKAGGLTADGFGRGRRFDGASGRRSTDKDGELLPCYSDPVGDLAVAVVDAEGGAHHQVDRVLRGANGMVWSLREAVRFLRTADGDRDVALGGGAEPEPEAKVKSCVNCGGMCLPAPKAGRCEECWRYRLDHDGQDRPVTEAEPAKVAHAHQRLLDRIAEPARQLHPEPCCVCGMKPAWGTATIWHQGAERPICQGGPNNCLEQFLSRQAAA